MELDKLEKLSCLKIQDAHRDSLAKSMVDVFQMMTTIQGLPIQEKASTQVKPTTFTTVHSECVAKDVQSTTIHLDEGLFLAPKVIKRD